MENDRSKQIVMILLLCTFSLVVATESVTKTETKAEIYIVQLSSPPEQTEDLESWYNTFMPTALDSDEFKPEMVFTYRNVLEGFAARLTAEQAREIEKKDGAISARPERMLSLHTTHTPDFLGLHQNLGFWKDSNYGKGIIIGVLDSGITVGHPSFDDAGVDPPPAKWKGKCEVTGCNNKLIGARNFVRDETNSPVDHNGHGTHTSTTAAGNFVEGANVHGNNNGTAAGIAPLAHVAMYKVCGAVCPDSAILAALDAAIEEGVDVLSLSLGSFGGGGNGGHGPFVPFYTDLTAIGAYAAIQKGIFVSVSAGNLGPITASISNEAPWMLTVGASSVDRKVSASVKLGNGVVLDGESLFQPKDHPETLLPLVYPGMNGDRNAAFCVTGSLKTVDVKGKVVICKRTRNLYYIKRGKAIKEAGGAAMIVINTQIEGATTRAEVNVLPASHVGHKDGLTILEYLNSTTSPVATIVFHGTIIGDKSAPQVAAFSSRGPCRASPGILKPDIIGPGVNIIAAWESNITPSFKLDSGTSMACPHLSGIAALLKNAHPDWSPAAIKSAIMTTAESINLNNQQIQDEKELPASLFDIGAGHVNPSKANDPGLVYDIQGDDYIPYLCGLEGYEDAHVSTIVRKKVSCSDVSSIPEAQLNYPSFAITLNGNATKTYTRTVTNVGDASSSYTVNIIKPSGMSITVSPSTLVFSELNQKLSYQVTFIPGEYGPNQYVEGAIVWKSINHSVRSPISIKYT